MKIHTSCRHYRGEIPCVPNKERGKECPSCDEYDPVESRILLIKLGAPGDVLRTTSLLPAIRRKWPGSEVTWLTRMNARDLLVNLPLVDRILTVEEQGIDQVIGESFSICMNLDNEPLASSIASRVKSDTLLGYHLDSFGRIVAANPEAEEWLELALFDRLKRENRSTYQAFMRRIIGVDPDVRDSIQVNLTPQEKQRARERLQDLGISGTIQPIAFNTGSGERWKTKRWPMESFIELALLLSKYSPEKILLLGGSAEDEINRLLQVERPDRFVYTGVIPLRDFMAVVSCCSLLVTADTLALHVGLGTDVPTVALFGPTSAPEIEGDNLLKITAPVECICCYLRSCEKTPFCMDVLTPDYVFKRIEESAFMKQSLQRLSSESRSHGEKPGR